MPRSTAVNPDEPKVDPVGFRRLLLAFRSLEKLTPARLREALAMALQDEKFKNDLDWLRNSPNNESDEALDKAIRRLEEGKIPKDLLLKNVLPLAGVYLIPTAMFGPLLSRPQTAQQLYGRIDDFISMPSETASPVNHGATYRVSNRHLQDTDARFVHLHLEPGGEADLHHHPGDELVYLMDGDVKFKLRSIGYRPRVTKGQFIHFHAELKHTAIAGENGADLFIIRFFQLEGGGVRATMQRRLQVLIDLMEKARDRKAEAVLGPWLSENKFDVLKPWLQQISEPAYMADKSPDRILDAVGLGNVLEGIEEIEKTEQKKIGRNFSWRDVFEKAVGAGGRKRASSELYHLVWGTGKHDEIGNLVAVARGLTEMYGHYPANVFSSCLFPRVQNMVLLRWQASGDSKEPETSEDFCDLSSIPGFEGQPGVSYLTPRYNLMGSDVAINILEFKKGAFTDWNKHPGFELALPLEGELVVEFEGGTQLSIKASLPGGNGPREYAHYISSRPHRVGGKTKAKALIVRFFEYAKPKERVRAKRSRIPETGSEQAPVDSAVDPAAAA